MAEQVPRPPAALSTGELIAQLSEQTSALVRDEMRLAQAELGAKAKHVGVGAGLFGAAGLLAFFGLAAAIATAIIALALVWPLWLAALAVTVVLLVIAGIMALVGKKQVKAAGKLKPERTMASIKNDVTEIKERASHEHP